MSTYLYDGREVDAEQWVGQDIEGARILSMNWGKVAEVESETGNHWMTPGDWLVRDGKKVRVVSPAIFESDYSAK